MNLCQPIDDSRLPADFSGVIRKAEEKDLSGERSARFGMRKPRQSDGGAFVLPHGPGAIRTRDLLLRRQALYPAELRTRSLKG